MDAVEPNLLALLIFAMLWTVCCIGAFQIAGMFPIGGERSGNKGLIEALAIINAILLAALAGLVLAYGLKELRWSSVVVAGGFIFLFAPFATENLPESFQHGTLGLFALTSVLCIALAAFVRATGQNLPFLAFIRS